MIKNSHFTLCSRSSAGYILGASRLTHQWFGYILRTLKPQQCCLMKRKIESEQCAPTHPLPPKRPSSACSWPSRHFSSGDSARSTGEPSTR
ncbi:hypothetical protein DESC_40027 [Desulfosarcina cetonica]|nr:hypothetical protein DESC_40027 [Desulfosarcina cetonica]